ARTADAEPKQLLPLLVATLQIIEDRPHQKRNGNLPWGTIWHFNNNDPRYSWLLASWLVEERRVPSGRLYRRGSLLDSDFEKIKHCVRGNQTWVSFDLAVHKSKTRRLPASKHNFDSVNILHSLR
ncbi:hypothetical protein Gogos_022233, partial [Gossypium gossypioides]|nr:hypothetical protein [Gossypium gossypioides]